MENIVDFDVEISLDYVLDNAEVKKYEEEVVDHKTTTREVYDGCLKNTTRKVYDGCLKTFKNQITLTRHKKMYHETKKLVNIDTVFQQRNNRQLFGQYYPRTYRTMRQTMFE